MCLLVTAGIGIALDLFTKSAAAHHLAPPDPAITLIPGYLHFTYVENHGAVFGLGQGWRWLFVLVSFAAIGFVGYLFAQSPRRWWHDITLGMLLAGILGNLYDRVVFGYVRDMIHALPRWPDLFPWVFNVADSLLCVSITILILVGIFFDERKQHETPAESAR
jgi:signal peptidase II